MSQNKPASVIAAWQAFHTGTKYLHLTPLNMLSGAIIIIIIIIFNCIIIAHCLPLGSSGGLYTAKSFAMFVLSVLN